MYILKIFVISLILINSKLFAESSNSFQVAPAPIPSPNFEVGMEDVKSTANYISIESSAFEMTGFGFNFSRRNVTNEKAALDVGGGVSIMSGDLKSGTINGDIVAFSFNIQLDLEYQMLKKDRFSLIGFLGFNFPIQISSSTISTGTSLIGDITTTTVMFQYGFPIGLQAGIDLGDFTLVPFFGLNFYLGGVASTTSSVGSSTEDTTVESYVSKNFGMDILYRPLDISFGTLLQASDPGGSGGQTDVFTFQISWNKQRNVAKKPETTNEIHKPTPPPKVEDPKETEENKLEKKSENKSE